MWFGAGVILAVLVFVISRLSQQFAYEIPLAEKPILLYIAIQVFAGILYLLTVIVLKKTVGTNSLFLWILLVGIILRVSMFVSTPILEDDFYRYLWDGAVTSNGINPYQYAPQAVMDGTAPAELTELGVVSGSIIERINHPHIRTIYPVVAQAFFAAAHWLGPWSMLSWRFILLAADIVTLVLVILTLKALNLSLVWLVIYWWNPLFVKEIFNSGHLDVVVLPFMLGALLLMMHKKYLFAVVALALATATKIWPIALLPLVIRPLVKKPRRLIASLVLFMLMTAVLFVPVYAAHLDSSSGFVAYSQSWENNSFAFKGVLTSTETVLATFGFHPGYGQIVARIVMVVLALCWIMYVIKPDINGPQDIIRRSVRIVAALFLLSPTQFPWYFAWFVPLLALQFQLSLILYTVLLPLYYTRFYLDTMGAIDIFNRGIVVLEHLPVWVLFIWEWLQHRKKEALVRTT